METRIAFRGLDALREKLAGRDVPHAARAALNRTAFAARAAWIDRAHEAMTLRNPWTARSIRVARAVGNKPERMKAVLGSAAGYMALQESGGEVRKQHKHGVSIPTSVASGEGRGSTRKKLVRRPNRLPSIQLQQRLGANRRQRNAIAVRRALVAGKRFVFLELERRSGIFRLAGGKRRPRLDMVWDLSRPAVRLPPRRTLEETLTAIRPEFRRNLLAALKGAFDPTEAPKWTRA